MSMTDSHTGMMPQVAPDVKKNVRDTITEIREAFNHQVVKVTKVPPVVAVVIIIGLLAGLGLICTFI